MGRYDNFHLAGVNDAVLCYEGHESRALQTQSLERTYLDYYLFEGCLYRGEPKSEEDIEPTSTGLEILQRREASPISLGVHGCVYAYTTCKECEPVMVIERDRPRFPGGPVGAHRLRLFHPWVEYVFYFDGGRLTRVVPNRLQSREALVEKHKGAHHIILEGDSRKVLEDIRQLEETRA